jgi:hypothetical protein
MQCVNGLLLQATVRGIASFVGLPPTEPPFGDLASLAKETVNSPAFKVAAVYAATNVAKRIMTKQVAVDLPRKLGRHSFLAWVKQPGRLLWARLSGTLSVGTRTRLKGTPVMSPNTGDCQRKSLALRLTGLCLGIAGLIATNSLPAYKAQVEVAFLTALVCWFFGYDFWDYRNQPRFRAGVIAYSRSTP